jgi:hypothetical protein
MPDRFCPSCGTEIDEDARFCPTCGRTLEIDVEGPAGEAETAAIPAAPAWPPPEPEPSEPEQELAEPGSPEPEPPELEPSEPEPRGDAAGPPAEEPPAPEPAKAPPPPPSPAAAPPGAAAPPDATARREPDLPITMPTTLSGWLIGAGSFLAALALLPRLGHLLDLVLFLALLAISASVFLADRLPSIDRQRMLILVVLMIGLGVGLERAGFAWRGTHTIFLVAMLFAAGGALLIEFDRDRPVTPPGVG